MGKTICFSGIEALPNEQRPPKEILLQWYGLVQQIEQRNSELDYKSSDVLRMFEQEGFKGCLLKGQGNAQSYPNPKRRVPGDIDIWLCPQNQSSFDCWKNRERVIKYVSEKYPQKHVHIHHIDYPIYRDTEIEVHFFPIYLKNPFDFRRLLCFFQNNAKEQFAHQVVTKEGIKMTIPTDRFNLIYQLVHVYLHYLNQGIGFRQIIDYYYILNRYDASVDRNNIIGDLRQLHLLHFAQAMMWLLHEVLGMKEESLYTSCDEREGRRLLDEILAMGNFGKYDSRYWKQHTNGPIYLIQKIRRQMHFLFAYPREVLWDPYFRLKQYFM